MTDTTAQSIIQTAPNADDTSDVQRTTEVSSVGGAESSRARCEVLEKPERRTFTADYKQRILAEDATPPLTSTPPRPFRDRFNPKFKKPVMLRAFL